MPTPTNHRSILSLIAGVLLLASCQDLKEVPFDDATVGFAQPTPTPISWGPETSITWPTKPRPLTSAPAAFNYAKLPTAIFDSLGMQPFAIPPPVVPLNFNALPSKEFHLDKVAEIPLRTRTAIIPAPELIRIPRPQARPVRADVVFEFPEPLNSATVDQIFRSRDGFIWMSTANRLYKYDGENLWQYSIPGLSTAMYQVTEDHAGNLWVVTRASGLVKIDFKNGVYQMMGMTEGMPSNSCLRVYADGQDRIWASYVSNDFSVLKQTPGGFTAVIDQVKKTVKLIHASDGLASEAPCGIMEDKQHRIWIPSLNKGISIIDQAANRITYLDKAHGLCTDTLTAIVMDSVGRIWTCGFFESLNVIDLAKGTITQFDKDQGIHRAFAAWITHDRSGSHWLGKEGAMIVVSDDLKRSKKLYKATGLISDGGGAIEEDQLGQLWVAGQTGINLLHKRGLELRRSGSAQVSTMLEDSHGRVWIGTLDNGIQIVDTATGLMRVYDKRHGLSDNLIQYLTEFDGKIFMSTGTGGIEIIDTSLKQIERIGAAQGIATDLTSIERDNQGRIWLGGLSGGVDILDLQAKTAIHIGVAEGLPDSSVIDIKKDKMGRLWFYSFNKGVGYIDPVKLTVRHVVKSDFPSVLGAREDNLMMHDDAGATWLMSSKFGYFMFNPAGDSVTRIGYPNGLLSNSPKSMHEYQGRFYFVTSRGLSIFTPPRTSKLHRWEVESLGKSMGLTKNIASYNSDMMLRNGQFWFGDDGITIVGDPLHRLADSLAPATFITGIDVMARSQMFSEDPWHNLGSKDTIWSNKGKPDAYYVNQQETPQLSRKNSGGMQWDSLSSAYNLPVNLRLPYNRNYLQFHFAQMHMGSQDTVWYRYIVEGVDQKWSDRTSNGFSENYPNLSPGKYRFRVSSYYRGKWSDPVSFSFSVLPPWWRIWWAWILYIIAAAALLRAYIVFRSRRLVRENKILEEKINLRTNQLQQSIEDLKATQGQLVQSEKMASLGELTAGIAHEIQNPLNFINNFAEINKELLIELKEEIDNGDKDAVKTLADDIIANEEKINHHGRRADGIVKSMLQHSRSNHNAVKEPTDINKLADEYLRLAYHGLRAKDKSFNATLKTDFDPALGNINIIANDMGRVILNLITNAFYAVGEKKLLNPTGYEPTVWVSTRKKGGFAEITVRDNANGIPQKVLDKIFQPFFTTKPAGQGTGLGLSMSYDIVRTHGGELRVDTKENEGTAFIISLPV